LEQKLNVQPVQFGDGTGMPEEVKAAMLYWNCEGKLGRRNPELAENQD